MKITNKKCCASSGPRIEIPSIEQSFVTGSVETDIGKIPVVPTNLTSSDRWGALKVRLDFGRDRYDIQPGLYATGQPNGKSKIFVTANYKLSFDALRRELKGVDAWILVLETRGINVWCAAGKGTFGTSELVRRIEVSGLKKVVKHRRLIVPQLGAVGVSAHGVKEASNFTVIFGPVRATDIPGYLEKGLKTTAEMRRVHFNFRDRLLVTPVELVQAFRHIFIVSIVFYIIAGFSGSEGFGSSFDWGAGFYPVLNLVLAYIAGTFLGPVLLPWLPGRSFSVKGVVIGLVMFLSAFFISLSRGQAIEIAAWLMMIPAIASFYTMNFTGSSTYTSLSGVKKEMKIAIPLQAASGVIGVVLWVVSRF